MLGELNDTKIKYIAGLAPRRVAWAKEKHLYIIDAMMYRIKIAKVPGRFEK